MEVLANLARQVCAQGNQIKAWNQTTGKFRNRLNRLEHEIDTLPGPEDVAAVNACSGVDSTDEADGLLVCDGGSSKILDPTDDSKEVASCGGKWKTQPRGLTFHPVTISTALASTSGTGSYASTLANYPDDPCGDVFALFEATVSANDGASGASHSRSVKVGDYVLAQTGYHDTIVTQQAIAKCTSSAVTFVITDFGSANGGVLVKLLGYYY